MFETKRRPFVGDEQALNFPCKRPNTKIKVERSPHIHSGARVLIDGTGYRILSVRANGPIEAGACFVRVARIEKPKRLQGKDLSTLKILQFLAQFDHSQWKSWWANLPDKDWGDWSIANQFPEINQSNEVVLLRKMSRLISKGYVNGCDCGCRGDFYITDEGRAKLKQLEQHCA
jgi:hypothetical protein